MYYADLHIHSPYAKATSKNISIEQISLVARVKGITLMGTGDCFHPVWMDKINKMKADDDNGLLYYKKKETYFIPTVEVSCEKNRRHVHILLVFPNMGVARLAKKALQPYGSMEADGRPVLKLTAQELYDEVKATQGRVLFIPAHCLTPYNGILGERNRSDTIFDAMDAIPDAIESGLSADQSIVRKIGSLDRVPIVSFSDAHSTPNIGREVTMFPGELSWDGIVTDLRDHKVKTIEFPPALGKYHFSGHRKCKYSTGADGRAMCPVCHKRITMGVEQRIHDIKTQEVEFDEVYIIPLVLLIAKDLNKPYYSEEVNKVYEKIVKIMPEIPLLLNPPFKRLKRKEFRGVQELLYSMRLGHLKIIPGYDNFFGKIVNLYPLMVEKMEEANDLFKQKIDHTKLWEEAETLSARMAVGGTTMTQEEYEAIHERAGRPLS